MTANGPRDYLELDRRFFLRNPNEDSEDVALRSYGFDSRFLYSGATSWEKLLERKGVTVILGEPGSGRTYEFKQQAARLAASGRVSFYIELQRLVNEDVSHLLDNEEFDVFQRWKSGSEDAFFFLDAVDEAKLKSVADFEASLRNFRRALDAAVLPRAVILISSRISEWSPETDLQRVRDHLIITARPASTEPQSATAKASEEDKIPVYVIAPLDPERVGHFARFRGLDPVQPFLDALELHHAWEFAGRPYDVDFLLRYWGEHQRLDSLAKMLSGLVAFQLKERDDKPDRAIQFPLAPDRARQGAEMLAAACVFCTTLIFRIPDQPPTDNGGTLEIDQCLPADWTPAERHALLDRPLFTVPAYGRIRFQHRRTMEYLAACWLQRLMKECKVAELRHLLFHEERGRIIVRQSRTAVAVWLVCLSQDRWALELGNLLLRAAPDAFFRFGDPSQLSLEFKRRIISSFVTRYENRDAVHIEADQGTLSRLGDPALAEELSTQLRSPAVPPGVKIELLKLAIDARLSGCVPVALELVTSDANRADLPSYAVWLVEKTGNENQKQQLAQIARQMPSFSASRCGQFLEVIFPSIITASELAAFLQRIPEGQPTEHDLSWRLAALVEQLPQTYNVVSLLEVFRNLLEQPPYVGKHPVSLQFAWLGKVVLLLLKRLLMRKELSDTETSLAARMIWLLSHNCFRSETYFSLDEGKAHDLDNLSGPHPKVRQQAFWLVVAEERGNRSEPEAAFWRGRSAFGVHLKFDATHVDLDWLIEDTGQRATIEDRETAFHLAWVAWCGLGQPALRSKALSSAIKDLPHLRHQLSRYRWQIRLRWATRPWLNQRNNGCLNSWWWKHRWSNMENFFNEIRDRYRLFKGIQNVRSGRACGWLVNLTWEARGNNRWAVSDWSKLTARYGRRITRATQQGCVEVWKNYTPPCIREGNGVANGLIAGLTGLQFLYEKGHLNFSSMSRSDAVRAARYALNEINDFSEWLGELAGHHPGVIMDVFIECLSLEWNAPADQENRPDVLGRLSYGDNPYGAFPKAWLAGQLRSGDPANVHVLRSTLSYLTKHGGITMQEWSALASARITQYSRDSVPFLTWLVLWMQADAGAALDFLETQILSPADTESRDNIVMSLCAALQDRHEGHPSLAHASYCEPWISERFICFVYRYVSPANDIHRRSGSYSPLPRDEAQQFRYNLLTPLAELSSPEADAPLRALAEAPELSTMRDVILHLMDKRAERMADTQPWPQEQVRGFYTEHEALPRNSDDLFHIVCRRLEDIKYDVEEAEESLRGAIRDGDNESRLQSFLVTELRRRNNGRYTAPKEPEIDGAQRPDIQVHCPEIPGHIQIEVKLADMESRSLASLLRDLETQLAGQYLRSHDATHGIYMALWEFGCDLIQAGCMSSFPQ